MKKFKASRDGIEVYEVLRETKRMVFYKEPHYRRYQDKPRQEIKESSTHKWCDTLDEAKAFATNQLNSIIEQRKKQLEQAEARLAKVDAMQEPQP